MTQNITRRIVGGIMLLFGALGMSSVLDFLMAGNLSMGNIMTAGVMAGVMFLILWLGTKVLQLSKDTIRKASGVVIIIFGSMLLFEMLKVTLSDGFSFVFIVIDAFLVWIIWLGIKRLKKKPSLKEIQGA